MSIRIREKTFTAEYLVKHDDLQKGMMGRNSLDGCMVFKMGRGHHSFWMKGCIIPLDIVFIFNNKINRIYHNCEPEDHVIEYKKYTGIGDHVIEFKGGTALEHGWNVGDKVAMYLGTPQNPVK